jgi:hypothetical protein
MSNSELGVSSCAFALAFLGFIVWQWRSNNFVDPIFRSFTPEGARRPLMWFTTLFYGAMALLSVYLAAAFFTGK